MLTALLSTDDARFTLSLHGQISVPFNTLQESASEFDYWNDPRTHQPCIRLNSGELFTYSLRPGIGLLLKPHN